MKAQESNNQEQFQVALLFDSLKEAKPVSDALRDIGVYAHLYTELDEFWVHINTQTPDLALVDVKKMSQGTLLLKNHPKAQSGDLSFAFYYSEETKFLTQSTFQFKHYGFIKKELELRGQVQSILKRFNEVLHAKDEVETLKERVQRLQLRSQRLVEDNEIAFNFNHQLEKLNQLVDRVGRFSSEKEYISQLITVFSEWDDVSEFGVYTLGQSGQKLVSPKAIRNKYNELPDLWLTRASEKGIDQFSQEMAHEVAFDLFNQNLRVVNIKARSEYPEIMILCQFNEDNLHQFNWDLLEERLSFRYMSFLMRTQSEESVTDTRTEVWNVLNYLDDIHFHQTQAKHKCVEIDLTNLVNVIKEKHGNRFYWKSFFQDFNSQLSEVLTGNFKVANFGVSSIATLIDNRYLEEDFAACKEFCLNFQYWRYFEDTAMMMNSTMYPKVKIIAPSSVNYLRQQQTQNTAAAQIPLETKVNRMKYRAPQLDA
tara:strand:- start:115043 stop:116488 length:1446 start_codon:yes stop_codon:yes gene_type:complete